MPEPIDVTEMLARNAPGFDLAAGEEPFPPVEVDGEPDEADLWRALEDVEDPELPVSLVDLGLIQDVSLEDGHATVTFTLTYTGCPAREIMERMIERRAESVPGVESATVDLRYDEPWTPADMTDAAREQLGQAGFACPLAGGGVCDGE